MSESNTDNTANTTNTEMFASSDFDQPAQPQVPTRVVGVFALLIGLGLAWWQILGPLQAAQRGEPNISYTPKAQFLALICLIGSLPMLILGNKMQLNQNQRKLDWKGWVLIIACVGIGIGFDQWLKGEFARLGYSNHR